MKQTDRWLKTVVCQGTGYVVYVYVHTNTNQLMKIIILKIPIPAGDDTAPVFSEKTIQGCDFMNNMYFLFSLITKF